MSSMDFTCIRCGESFTPAFRSDQKYCSRRCSDRARDERWRTRHPDRVKARNESFRERHPERVAAAVRRYDEQHREERNQKARDRRLNNPERVVEIRARHYRKHPERNRARVSKFKKAHKNRYVAYRHNYFAQLRQNGGTVLAAEWEYILEKFGRRCLKCGRSEPQIRITMDHIVPISKGGKHTKENIQPLCISCNSSKKQKIVDYRISI